MALGVAADGRPAGIAANSRLVPMPAGRLAVEAARAEVTARLDGVIAAARAQLPQLADELISQDLVLQLVAALDEQRWLLRAGAPDAAPARGIGAGRDRIVTRRFRAAQAIRAPRARRSMSS